MVELSRALGDPVIDTYAVQDKVQQAEVDASMIVEDELFAAEAWDICIVCGANDETHEMMYCDGCDRAVHVFCAGYEEMPEVWYCETCLVDLEMDAGLPGIATAVRRQSRRRGGRLPPAPTRRRQRDNDTIWARVWQEVSRRLDLDLDFPFDDDNLDQRTPEQRRELAHWQRRMEVAHQHGAAADRIRDIAAARLQRSQPTAPPIPEPESQEEIRAWNAFDKARESQDAPLHVRRRKRKATDSPVSPREPEQTQQQPQLKRPRLRARHDANPHAAGESSEAATRRANDERSTFLSSLLKDVENKPMSAGSPGASDQFAGPWSPRNSSPIRSPTSSGHATPRALSPTPPPQAPISPPLSATRVPGLSPTAAIFSPFSPTAVSPDNGSPDAVYHRGRQREARHEHRSGGDGPVTTRASSGSPSRTLSYSAKEEIQRMVKLALGPRYRDKEINKEQYTDINRDISRKMYDLVGDASALTDQAEREKWQSVAEDEVKRAISTLHFGSG